MEPDDEELCGDSTQIMSQTQPQDFKDVPSEDFSHLWGRLVPASPGLNRLDFSHAKPQYTIGRAPTADFRVVAPRISGTHCTVNYNANDGKVIITDHSTNGTFVSLSCSNLMYPFVAPQRFNLARLTIKSSGRR